MKKIKSFGSLVIVSWCIILTPFLSGCINIPKTVAALAKDPASSHVSIKSIYVSIDWTRANPSSNTPPHSLSPTGNVEVKK